MINLKNVEKSTWVRMITLLVVLVNQVVYSFFGIQLFPYMDEQISEAVSLVLTIVVTIWASWKNNSFTTEAQLTDEQLRELKNQDGGGL